MSVCFCTAFPAPFGFSPGKTECTLWACSLEHLDFVAQHYGEPMPDESVKAKAREKAGQVAGGYLESIGKTDLAVLTAEEFDIFLQAVIETNQEEIKELCQPF